MQLAAEACPDAAALAALLGEPVRRAAAAGAGLVVLPQLADLIGRDRLELQVEARRVAAELARGERIHLVFGAAEGGKAGFLCSPGGEVIGRQRQTHLLPPEKEWGLVPGDELFTFDTEVGRLGLLVGTDAWYPEVSRILALQGAQVLLSLQAVCRPYTPWRQVAGIWQEAQQNQTFAVESCLSGRLAGSAGLEFEGRSAVFAPCEMTPGETGILNDTPDEAGLVLARLDFAARERVISRYPVLGLLNSPLYHRYFPGVYTMHPGSEGGAQP